MVLGVGWGGEVVMAWMSREEINVMRTVCAVPVPYMRISGTYRIGAVECSRMQKMMISHAAVTRFLGNYWVVICETEMIQACAISGPCNPTRNKIPCPVLSCPVRDQAARQADRPTARQATGPARIQT